MARATWDDPGSRALAAAYWRARARLIRAPNRRAERAADLEVEAMVDGLLALGLLGPDGPEEIPHYHGN